jgi:HlyD family secretion protein
MALMSKKSLMWILAAVAVAAAFFGYQYWQQMQSRLPKGIASGNGRIEAKLVDIAAKEALRVKEIRVDEGDLVKPGDVLVQMDTTTLEAQLAEAKLNVATTQEKEAVGKAAIARRKAEIELAKIEVKRSTALVAARAGSQRELDVRRTALQTTTAGLQEERKPSCARLSKRSKSRRRMQQQFKPASTMQRSSLRSMGGCCIA